jgi:Glycosyl hydrolase family 9
MISLVSMRRFRGLVITAVILLLLDHSFSGDGAVNGDAARATARTDPDLTPSRFNYAEVLQKALFFFDAQRSGKLPNDFCIEWRGDSALDDGKDAGIDPTGGYSAALAAASILFRAYYDSRSGYYDELVWSALWLHKATGETDYLQKAETIFAVHCANAPMRWTHSWDDKRYGAAVILAQLTRSTTSRDAVRRWLDY